LNRVPKGYKVIRRRMKQMATTSQADIYVCDVCGAEMLEIHCKLICPRCGFTRDCSDP
jgi:rubrerythrin